MALLLRFIAGAAMAGVYPVGMKLAASWAKGDLGLLIGLVLFAVVPALCALPVWLLPHMEAAWPMGIAALSVMLGAAVERWLFFAEARHVVTLYY